MDDSPFAQVPIEVIVRVGRARPRVAELLDMQDGSVLPLDSQIDDPVELYVGERLIGRGLLEEIEDQPGRLAVRMTEVVSGAAPR